MSENTGKQGGAPSLPNNWNGQSPKQDGAPKVGGGSTLNWAGPESKKDRGKDGTQG